MQGRMCGLGREGDSGEGVRERGRERERGRGREGEGGRRREGGRETERQKGRRRERGREGEKEDQMMIHRAARIHQSVSAITLYLAHLRKYES